MSEANGWRVALRLARRSVRPHLGRSLLIIALIALPVAGATVTDGLVRTVTDRDVDVNRAMGSADVRIDVHEGRKTFDVDEFLPPGAHAVPIGPPNPVGTLRFAVGNRVVRTRPDFVVLNDPLTTHLARLAEGRWPANPNETLVTRPLAERLGVLDDGGDLRPGATLRTITGELGVDIPPITITGLAVKPSCLSCADVVTRADSVLKKAMLNGTVFPLGYLVDLPEDVDPATLARTWSSRTSSVTTRDSYLDTTPFGGYLADAAGEPVALFAGLGLIGIVITAGAAFSIGTRRQIHELGLVVVNGGAAGHVRRIVLAQGLVLGVLGAAAGLVLGATATVLGVSLWQRMMDQLIEDPRFGWGELAAAAGVGVLAGVIAAAVPAIGVARMRPVDALAGRFRTGTPRARVSVLGVLLVFAGTAAVLAAAVVARDRLAEHQPHQTLPVVGTLAGAVVTVVGLVLVMPGLIAALGRLGAVLPLSGRLAVRDAVRHRQRTVAAGAAVMITVTGSVVTAFVFTTRADTVPKTLPDNTVLIERDLVGSYGLYRAGDFGEQDLDNAAATVTRAVPGAVVHKVSRVSDPGLALYYDPVALHRHRTTSRCVDAWQGVGIGTPELIGLTMGRTQDAGVRAALAEGKVVVLDDCLLNSDDTMSMGADRPGEPVLHAYRARGKAGTESFGAYLPRAFISAEAAAANHWGTFAESVAVTYPSAADLETIRTVTDDLGMDLIVGESAGDDLTSLYLALAGVAALVAFLGAGVTVALSATDGRADLATLAALGAPPRRRRTLAGVHALVVTGLGTLAGLAVGVCTAVAAVPVVGLTGLSVPWQHLWLTALAVPLLASVMAVVVTPSRLTPPS